MNMKQYWYLWVTAAALLIALGSHPYSYYQILRWVVSASAAYTAYNAYQGQQTGWAWVFAIVAVLFNPIAPITMARETWQLFDVAGAAICGVYAFRARVN
ncbi:hypothetical protein EXS57_02315 [Candidatus Kaiserbacteria bacterium]|nr:hypothetical protein [Candidatus Kaiserbacteria bacterium]